MTIPQYLILKPDVDIKMKTVGNSSEGIKAILEMTARGKAENRLNNSSIANKFYDERVNIYLRKHGKSEVPASVTRCQCLP